MFEIVDNQRGLCGPVYKKFCRLAMHLDAHVCPGSRDQVRVRFVHAGRFAPETVEVVLRRRDVLRRVISAELIVGASVGGTKVKTLVLAWSWANPKRNPDEAARAGRCTGGGLPGELTRNR